MKTKISHFVSTRPQNCRNIGGFSKTACKLPPLPYDVFSERVITAIIAVFCRTTNIIISVVFSAACDSPDVEKYVITITCPYLLVQQIEASSFVKESASN